eukprot:GHVH01003653.1.p1 GENE.GHVH01003653.1~~GHVH01003653.1.p1  ORF type:complete len:370 (+),score=35.96 GHVH01003653.1:43-1152(+)
MDVRTAIQKVTESQIGKSVRKRRRRKARGKSSNSSNHYGSVRPIPKPKHRGRQCSDNSDDHLSINISDKIDPYSTLFDPNAILEGNTTYRSDYKDSDPLGRYWKRLHSSISTKTSKSSSTDISSHRNVLLPKKKVSTWPNYSSNTDSSSSYYSYSDFETYSCSDSHCRKLEVDHPGVTRKSRGLVPCPRTDLATKRHALPPLEDRGYEKVVKRTTKDLPSSISSSKSSYSYSYSSCSDSSCSKRGTMAVTTSKKKSMQLNCESSKHLNKTGSLISSRTSLSTKSSRRSSTKQPSLSTKSSRRSSTKQPSIAHKIITKSHSTNSSDPLSNNRSGQEGTKTSDRSSKDGLNTKATGTNVLATTSQYEKNLR